jgi:putative SOS response-associated peptidase YedK
VTTTFAASLETVSILTTEANDLVRFAHERMPVILPRGAERRWLDVGGEVLLRPYPPEEMAARPVSDRVNSARHEGPQCIEPPCPAQRSLF